MHECLHISKICRIFATDLKKSNLLWKIPLVLLETVTGFVLLLVTAVIVVVATPSCREAVLEKGVAVANEKTDFDIDLGHLYLSPFHHSPMVLYRAYKGKTDLPLGVEVDSLFVGHRGQDTLIYVRALHLKAIVQTSGQPDTMPFNPLTLPIEVEKLHLRQVTFHSDSLIAAVGLDIIVDSLDVTSPELIIAKGQYPLHGLRLEGADVGVDLRKQAKKKEQKQDSPKKAPMAFDIPDGELRRIHFQLTPLGMHIKAKSLSTNTLVNVGGNVYDARRLNVGGFALDLPKLYLPFDTIDGNAYVDIANSLITSTGLHAHSEELGADAKLKSTLFNLKTMRVETEGEADFKGSKATLRAFYDIDDQLYGANVEMERVDLSPFLKRTMNLVLAGSLQAEGKGINPSSPAMRSKVHLYLKDAIYEQINVSGLDLDAALANKTVEGTMHLPVTMRNENLKLKANTEHRFRVSDFMKPEQMAVDYHATMRQVQAQLAKETLNADVLTLDFATDTATSLDMETAGLSLNLESPMHVLKLVDKAQALKHIPTSFTDLNNLDTLRRLIPDLVARIALTKGSPIQGIIERKGLDIDRVALALNSDEEQTTLELDAAMPETDSTKWRLPAVKAAMKMMMREGVATATLTADTKLTDGAASMHDLRTDANLWLDLERKGEDLHGKGCFTLDDLSFKNMDFGSRAAEIVIAPSKRYAHAWQTDVRLDDIPLTILDSIVRVPGLALQGAIRAKANIDGLPSIKDISAEVVPLGVTALYTKYGAQLSLGEEPIIMEHNKVDLNGLPIYGADSTFLQLNGGLDLNTMRLDVVLKADSFAPVKLEEGGQMPVYGDLAVDIDGTVSGPLDSILADVDVTILPNTDITYPIDKKNLAQVKPYGTVNVQYGTAGKELNLGGRINVDNGFIRYSPKLYPIMPFRVDSGSHVDFNGPIKKTRLNVAASQKVSSNVQSAGEEMRSVDFITGVRIKGELDTIGLGALSFFLEAPKDETISRELAIIDEDAREGLATTLLATGVYMGESNVAAKSDGYALTTLLNSRLNAAVTNSKGVKWMDVNMTTNKNEHSDASKDYNLSLSKSFFDDRLRVTVGAKLANNPDMNTSGNLFYNVSADYKLTKKGNLYLRLFSQSDYSNIFEGSLIKSGLGLRSIHEWTTKPQIIHRADSLPDDTISRTYGLTADANIVYRSNNSIGPEAALTSSVRNLLGKGETLTVKGEGAYYWALRGRKPGDPKKTDSYKLGVRSSLLFPYLHWAGTENPSGDTRYMLGYQYENIAGGYGAHRVFGSLTYFIRTSKYVTHAFTPFSLSVAFINADTTSFADSKKNVAQLLRILASDELVPAISYDFIYDNYRSKRPVNTMFEIGVKESGNIINGLYCAFGHKWDEKDKPLGSRSFSQFVKVHAELHNKFNFTEDICIATRLFAGANIPIGNSVTAPLSEAYYAGGPNSLRSAPPYSYGPGNYYSDKYSQSFFHSGDIKLEANFEFRFPIFWKIYGATFLDAGNTWNWYNTAQMLKDAGQADLLEAMGVPADFNDCLFNNPDLPKQIALGTGAGLRLDFEGLVIRLDLGVAIHSPYQTYRYDKDGKPDKTQPINTYFNIPSVWDAMRLNFGIGYPF